MHIIYYFSSHVYVKSYATNHINRKLNILFVPFKRRDCIYIEEDDYEYGAVDAPIGLAWAVGLLAILTALLPLALKGGEEAFEEMKSTDADTWGTGNSNKLNKKR